MYFRYSEIDGSVKDRIGLDIDGQQKEYAYALEIHAKYELQVWPNNTLGTPSESYRLSLEPVDI